MAGGASLGIEVWSAGAFSGRVAVAAGGGLVWAFTQCTSRTVTLDSKNATSVSGFDALGFGFHRPSSCQIDETAYAIECSASNLQLLADRKRPYALAGGGEDRVDQCRRERRHAGFADAAGRCVRARRHDIDVGHNR